MPERRTSRRLKEAFGRFGEDVLNQVEFIDPDIVIGGSTLGLFYRCIGVNDAEIDKSDPMVWSVGPGC